jgi:hypothetical protein
MVIPDDEAFVMGCKQFLIPGDIEHILISG